MKLNVNFPIWLPMLHFIDCFLLPQTNCEALLTSMPPITPETSKEPLINCHTHVFTGDHVPPYLARTFLPWPFYLLIPVSLVIRLFRFWYNGPDRLQYTNRFRRLKKTYYQVRMAIKRNGILRIANILVGTLLIVYGFFILCDWLEAISHSDEPGSNIVDSIRLWLERYGLLRLPKSGGGKVLLVLLLLVFFKPGRNLIFILLKKFYASLGVLPGPKSRELAKRYLTLGRFAFYKQQARIFGQLKRQYPPGTGFIVLPMDMEYMEAGKLKNDYCYSRQMEELAEMKRSPRYRDILFPFVFAEPRRLAAEGVSHFKYRAENGQIQLEDCFIKRYIEDYHFSGFKIYPALGYYPFDEELLPLWKYAADNALPVLTHCIRGTIYYRGDKLKAWDHHPVLEQSDGKGGYEPMLLLEIKNREFCNNFTHPLNYLCLLEEKLLRKVVGKTRKQQTRDLFGYTDDNTRLKYSLEHLKLCFGHYGGDDEWDRFMELDRDNFSPQLVEKPYQGISFFKDANGRPTPGKLDQLWKHADWYSLISSIMLQYPNVYADLSYIIHNPSIQPLLRQTLQNPILKKKVLFGTDFYVVRNHKTEKNMLADMGIGLSEEDFDQIARVNPRAFLHNSLP